MSTPLPLYCWYTYAIRQLRASSSPPATLMLPSSLPPLARYALRYAITFLRRRHMLRLHRRCYLLILLPLILRMICHYIRHSGRRHTCWALLLTCHYAIDIFAATPRLIRRYTLLRHYATPLFRYYYAANMPPACCHWYYAAIDYAIIDAMPLLMFYAIAILPWLMPATFRRHYAASFAAAMMIRMPYIDKSILYTPSWQLQLATLLLPAIAGH